jgi:hypothetical protein
MSEANYRLLAEGIGRRAKMKSTGKNGLLRALGFGLLAVLLGLIAASAGVTQAEKGGSAAAAGGTNGVPTGQSSPNDRAFVAQVAASQHLPADRLQVIDQTETDLPLTGVSFREAKVIDKQTGQEYSAAIGASGQKVDGDAARQAEQAARQQEYGKLQPSLAGAIGIVGNKALPVAIWVHPPDLSDLRKDPDPNATVYKSTSAQTDAAYQQYVATVQSRIAAVTGPVLAALAKAGYHAEAAANAPLIAAELPASAIRFIALRPDVDAVFDASSPASPNVPLPSLGGLAQAPDFFGGPRDTGRSTERAPQAELQYGLSGFNSKVAIVNQGGLSFANPFLNNATHNITQMNANGDTGASFLAGIIASTDGMARGRAPNMNRLYAANFVTFNQTNVQNAGAWAIANGANVIDAALSHYSTDPSGFDWLTVYFDYVASTTWQLVTASSGITGGPSTGPWSPAAGYNVLAAGYLDDRGNPYGSNVAGTGVGPPTSQYGPSSNYFTTMSDHAKPDVLAKGSSVYSTNDTSPWIACADCGVGYYSRTEYAAAAAAGQAATVTQANFNYLKVWPEVLRAIMIAGADDDVANRPSGTDTRIKGLDAYAAAFTTQPQDNHTSAYWGGYLTPASFDANGNFDLTWLQFSGGSLSSRVAIAWDSNPATEGSDTTYHGLNADLDLQIIDANGNLVAYSASYLEARELVDGVLGGTAPYTIRIHRFRFTPNTHTYVGVAYNFMAYLPPQRDASFAPCLGSTSTQVPPGGGIFSGDTRSGGNYWDAYEYDAGGGPGWAETGPERLYFKYTAVQGFLTATLTYREPGQDLNVFIVQDSDREPPCGYDDPTHPFLHKHLVSYGITQATYHVTQPGWYGFIVDGYNGSAGQYTLNVQWKPIQPPSGTPLPTLIPTITPGATPPTPPSHDTPATEPPTPTSAPLGTQEPSRTVAPTSTFVPASTITPPQPTDAPTNTPVGPHPTQPPCTVVFSDVPGGSTFYTYIHWLACGGVVNGYSDGTFRPSNNATRAQFAKMIVLGVGWTLANPTNNTFHDVSVGSTFYTYVETAVGHGIINGYPCGGAGEPCDAQNRPYFRPNNNITRGQLSKLLMLARGWALYTPNSPTFEDVPQGSTFYTYIETVVHKGIASGYPCGGAGEPCDPQNRPYFRPNNNATRGQISKMLYITLDLPQNP